MRHTVTKLVVVAHAADETAGATKLLADHAGELRAAVALAKIRASQCVETKLPIADLDAGWNIRAIANEIAAVLDRHREVDSLYTHAYEGGHPDHDAVALAARLAVAAGLSPYSNFPNTTRPTAR